MTASGASPPPFTGEASFPPGATVVLREVVEGRCRSARPLRVVADDDSQFVGYLVPGSTVAWPRLADGAQSQTPDQGWQLCLEAWFGPGALFIVPRGAAFAAVLFFERERSTPQGWKVDFLRPLARTEVGFDTLDLAFDLLADFELRDVHAKDADDLAQLRRLHQLSAADDAALEDARATVTDRIAARAAPFGPPWTAWRPDPTWAPLSLPAGWEIGPDHTEPRGGVYHGSPAGQPTGAALATRPTTGPVAAKPPARPRGLRSARGMVGLDSAGRVVYDLDLAGRTQLHGHSHPAIVEALQRQAELGWSFGAAHPTVVALERTLLAALPPGWQIVWTASPAEASAHAAAAGAALAAPVLDLGARLAHGLGPLLGAATAGVAATTWPEPPCGPVAFGASLFGGLGGGAVALPPQALGLPGARLPARPADDPPSALASVVALETLHLLTAEALEVTAARAQALRETAGLGGDGPYLTVPPDAVEPLWRAGVLVGADGRGLLATVASDADISEVSARIESAGLGPLGQR